jgi:pimeloyl-ACP methyl ester carboxylesterase
MQLLLVHGMGRTAFSMRRLAQHLRSAGRPVELFGYMTAVESFDRIVERVQQRIESLAARGPYAVIGHSLGGLLVRVAVARFSATLAAPAHLIMLGTPNQPPRLARRYQRYWPYRWINGECGQVLGRGEIYAELPPLSIPYTIIAGTGGRCGRSSPFGADPNDGVVAVDETLVTPADQPVMLPVRHTFMMNDARVWATIQAVLARLGA